MLVLLLFAVYFAPVRAADVVPLSIAASQVWDGNDGQWSSFGIQIGTPPQSVRVLPSTSDSGIWVVLGEGCTTEDGTDCSDNRGLIYKPEQSTSWSQYGTYYELLYGPAAELGYSGNAEYARDNVTLGYGVGDGVAVGGQMISGYAAQFPFLGMLGLAWPAINLSTLQDTHPSLLENLYNNHTIPSLSWAYTAGASYQKPPAYGSLTLGGYDSTQFVPNDVQFSFSEVIPPEIFIALKSIKSNTTSESLLSDPIYITVDTMVSIFWLPEAVTTQFEEAFNLSLTNVSTDGPVTQMYLLSDEQHNALLAQNPTITFTLAPQLDSTAEVDIVLPYSAFDLQLSQPFVEEKTWYFPLQRAANNTQYILGRAFMQEAYIIADYQRGNFSIYQAAFPDTDVARDILAIYPPGSLITSHPSSHHTGAIAGGAVAGVLVIAALIAAMFYFRRRRTPQAPHADSKPESLTEKAEFKAELDAVDTHKGFLTTVNDVPPTPPCELDAVEPAVIEVVGSEPRSELDSSTDTPTGTLDSLGFSSWGPGSGTQSSGGGTHLSSNGTSSGPWSSTLTISGEPSPGLASPGSQSLQTPSPLNSATSIPAELDARHRFPELEGEILHPSGRRRFSWENVDT